MEASKTHILTNVSKDPKCNRPKYDMIHDTRNKTLSIHDHCFYAISARWLRFYCVKTKHFLDVTIVYISNVCTVVTILLCRYMRMFISLQSRLSYT